MGKMGKEGKVSTKKGNGEKLRLTKSLAFVVVGKSNEDAETHGGT